MVPEVSFASIQSLCKTIGMTIPSGLGSDDDSILPVWEAAQAGGYLWALTRLAVWWLHPDDVPKLVQRGLWDQDATGVLTGDMMHGLRVLLLDWHQQPEWKSGKVWIPRSAPIAAIPVIQEHGVPEHLAQACGLVFDWNERSRLHRFHGIGLFTNLELTQISA